MDGSPWSVVLAPAGNVSVTGVGRKQDVPVGSDNVVESPEPGFSNSWSCHIMAVGFAIVELVAARW